MSDRGNLINKVQISIALPFVIAGFLFVSSDSSAQRTSTKIRRLPTNSRVGTLSGGGTVSNVKKSIDKYYKFFEKCMIDSSMCGEDYHLCFDTTNEEMQKKLTTSKEKCFKDFFGPDNDNEEIKTQAFGDLSLAMSGLCTEANNRQEIFGGGCKEMLANQSPGYLRYKECVRSACISMDGGTGNFAGCFGSIQSDTLADATGSCEQMLSTYTYNQADSIKKELMKEIRSLEEKSCNKMLGTYTNSNDFQPGGSCKVYVGYTREQSMTKKHSLGGIGTKKEFYAITAGGDFYETAPSTFPTYPAGTQSTDINFFGRFEKANQYDVGTNVFCSYNSFGLQQLYSYDSTSDSKYGSGLTGNAVGGGIGAADMQLILGAVTGAVPLVTGFLSKEEGADKLVAQTEGINSAKDALKPLGETFIGMGTLSGDKGKQLRIGEEIKGTCTIQGGMSYREGDTIMVRWQ